MKKPITHLRKSDSRGWCGMKIVNRHNQTDLPTFATCKRCTQAFDGINRRLVKQGKAPMRTGMWRPY